MFYIAAKKNQKQNKNILVFKQPNTKIDTTILAIL